MDKVCKIINGKFSWLLQVDGRTISFLGRVNADYFENHYVNIGYTVERIDQDEEE